MAESKKQDESELSKAAEPDKPGPKPESPVKDEQASHASDEEVIEAVAIEEERSKHEDTSDAAEKPTPSPKEPWWHFFKTKLGIVVASIVGVLVLAGVLAAFPTTRYGIAGAFLRKDLTVTIVDSKTSKAVTDAEVSVPGTTAHTDSNGRATLAKLPVGQYTVSVQKKNYANTNLAVTVPILSNADAGQVKLEATGRQVPVTVTHKITGQPVEKVAISVGEATALTDAKGEATVVLPADASAEKATLKLAGYNDADVEITVVEQKDPKNDFAITPAGKVYFLSKRTGKINVMKSDLDGANQQVVIQGTGKEEEGGTVLLAARDWKYLMLLSRRDSDKAKLYLINTSNDQMSVADEGNVNFKLAGWMNHTFIYEAEKIGATSWEPAGESLKSFNADNNKLTKLDGVDASNQAVEHVYLLDAQNTIVYNKRFDGPDFISSVGPDGNNKKTVKEFDDKSYVQQAVLYAIDEIYYSVWQNNKLHYYEYENGAVKEDSSIKPNDFSDFYPTYLISPSGQKTFWYEPRDGKNTLLIGDKEGKDGKEVAALSEFTPYGWFTEDYLLVSKGGSELYILSATNPEASKALKLTDYHKPNIVYRGYGGGYGGGF